jgi:hypothetical protein
MKTTEAGGITMSRCARVCIQLLAVVLVACFGIAVSANEQIAWRYDPNLKTNSLLRRAACTESEKATCKQNVRTCYEDCTKVPDLGGRSACFQRCAFESLACFKACGN